MESDMARMLAMLDKIAAEHGDAIPELNDMVKTEIAAQSRANPNVVAKVAQRVADEGRDPVQTLSRALPPSEVQDLERRGRIKIAPPALALRPVAAPEGAASAGAPRMVLRLPGAPASGEPSAAAAPEASAEGAPAASASAPAEVASIAPRLPGLLPRGPKPAGDKPAAPAAAGDKPAAGTKPAPRGPRVAH